MVRLILVGLVVLFMVPDLAAQYRSMFVCWSPCFPDQLLGAMLGGVPHNKAKWFFELKGKRSGAKGTEYDFSKLLAEDFDDEFKGEKSSITTIRIGRIFKLHKERVTVIGLYLGIGIADKTKYLQYYDKYEILDDEGNYYLDNGGKLLISPALGFMIFGKEVMSKFGIDINPTGVAIGIGYMF